MSKVTYLDRIVAAHRASAMADTRSIDDLVTDCGDAEPVRPFAGALRQCADKGEMAVIAELKRKSPSKGVLASDLDPILVAEQYRAGGAACMSVLTDVDFFGGSVADLQVARAACGLPVIRKDFTVSANDVADARLMGADCVLLIVAALDDAELATFAQVARIVKIDALFEIHDEPELERALRAGASLVGVNQRDLVTFEVDHVRAERMAAKIPDSCVKVAESGVRDAADAQRLHDAGFHAVLVGETLMRAENPASVVLALRGIASRAE